jgi:hypothetical protein
MGAAPMPLPPTRLEVVTKSEAPQRYLPAEYMHFTLKQIAEQLSNLRKIRRLADGQHLDYLRNMPYSREDMQEDWDDACAFVALLVLEGSEINFRQLEPASYPILEGAWLKSVNQLRAYYQWRTCDQGTPEANYFKASADLRQRLLGRKPAGVDEFAPVKDYLTENFLSGGPSWGLDESNPRADMLIRGKARRIWETTRNPDADANWFRARTFAHMYYDNIVLAVIGKDVPATASILKAFQFSKSLKNRYLIINCFEVAIASEFLDKDIVRNILLEPGRHAFSMVPVDNWPGQWRASEKIKYCPNERHIVYEGVMEPAERDELLKPLVEPQHREAVLCLFDQSQLGPLENMVL